MPPGPWMRSPLPDLICSHELASNGDLPLCLAGEWLEGDVVFLATDALACWFLKLHGQDRRPWHDLRGIQETASFADFVRRERETKAMRNDDVSLL